MSKNNKRKIPNIVHITRKNAVIRYLAKHPTAQMREIAAYCKMTPDGLHSSLAILGTTLTKLREEPYVTLADKFPCHMSAIVELKRLQSLVDITTQRLTKTIHDLED